MRLLSRANGVLYISPDKLPTVPYAILSHTWLEDEEEVSYKDVVKRKREITALKGYAKVDFCLTQAAKRGIEHVWIDTCCIDRRNNTELNEAINSMFEWYAKAEICFAYLADVPHDNWAKKFRTSRWFTRGWTLQELVAPSNVRFFSHEMKFLGTKYSLRDQVFAATGIVSTIPLQEVTLPQRFAWSLSRSTTRPEDKSYCLLGILNAAMVTFYGANGQRAQDMLFECVEKEHGRNTVRALQRILAAWEWKAELSTPDMKKHLSLDPVQSMINESNTAPSDDRRSPVDGERCDILVHYDGIPLHVNIKDLVDTAIVGHDLEDLAAILERADLQIGLRDLLIALQSSAHTDATAFKWLLNYGTRVFGSVVNETYCPTLLLGIFDQSKPPLRDVILLLIERAAPGWVVHSSAKEALAQAYRRGYVEEASILLCAGVSREDTNYSVPGAEASMSRA